MVMDQHFYEFHETMNGFVFNDETAVPSFDQHPTLANGYKFKDEPLDLSFLDVPYLPPEPDPTPFVMSTGPVSDLDSPDEFSSDTVFKFLNQILMEENMDAKPSMFHDPLALQAAEKSLYDALGENYPTSSYPPPGYVIPNSEIPEDNFFVSSSEGSTNSSTSASNSADSLWVGDSLESKSSAAQIHPLNYPSQQYSGSTNSFNYDFSAPVDSFTSSHLVPNIFSDSESIMQFKRGMEEASKFLPPSNPIVIDLDKYNLPSDSKDGLQEVVIKVEKDEGDNSPNGSRGRKHYHLEDSDYEEERSSKQSAVYVEEAELSEMFDRVLLCTNASGQPVPCCEEALSHQDTRLQQKAQAHPPNGGKARSKKQGNNSEAVDLRTLLVSCAQSVATDDRRTTNEQLKQIRQHASISGDSCQRLAHIFAAGLEARLAGTGSQLYAAQSSKRISAAEKLKAYQVYLSACPFKKISMFFANKMIIDTASTASTLHIVDFGIQYGFQWPILIQRLSERVGGPPKLRITGIELPQPGFRPAERVEETGRRLANYCERFHVPFEYNAIATQHWESIKIEDLKIERDEFLAVNCLFRFKNLLDETVVVDSPRDAVLKLIRRMKPDIFVNAIINGSYSAPFFVTRFREALFHYSSLFDMFDATLDRENEQRLNFEKEFYGREAMNVIACEGAERVERPETYKQWQFRNTRAGFKMLPLDQELIRKFRNKVKSGYHKDFLFDEDGKWVLQGWKGRILCASSCWIPA